MYRRKNLQIPLVLLLIWLVTAVTTAGVAQPKKSLFPDNHTIGLWLFDETQYPHTTLTDASEYEYDLRLQKGGELVESPFRNALKVTPGPEHAVSYAGFKGSVPIGEMREKNGTPSGLWGPTAAPGKILGTLAGGNWTWEFWLMLASVPTSEVTIIDLGQAYEPGFSVVLKTTGNFEIKNAYGGIAAICQTKLTFGHWNHIAFAWDGSVMRHFTNGFERGAAEVSKIQKQPTPAVIEPEDREHGSLGFSKDKSLEWRRGHRFNFTVGHDRQGNKGMNGLIDELRFSDVVRYSRNFALPGSFSHNYGVNAPKPAVANGPPLLFAQDSPKGSVRLGARKHLFIDDVLIDKKQNIRLTCNPPTNRQDLNLRPERSAWRASCRCLETCIADLSAFSPSTSGKSTWASLQPSRNGQPPSVEAPQNPSGCLWYSAS